jgi:hypothetical protein
MTVLVSDRLSKNIRMTPESANICSKLLILRAGEAPRLRCPGSHRILRPQRSGRTCRGSQRIAIYGCAYSDQYRNVFVSVQKYFFLGTSIWSWTSALDPKLGGKKMVSEKTEKCAHPLCSCVTTSGKYCSAECQATEKTPEIACACPHAGCKGKTH